MRRSQNYKFDFACFKDIVKKYSQGKLKVKQEILLDVINSGSEKDVASVVIDV